jgi:hypothetical protein
MLRETAAATETNVRRGFEDGLGRRYRPAARLDGDTPLEILCFRHEITDVPAFEFALRERVARLSEFHHPAFARIRKVDRLNDERGTVALMSDGVVGDRLVDILADVERSSQVLDLNAALNVIRQLLTAMAVFHQHARVAHGAIAPERLFVTPRGRVLIVEYSLGAALEQLKYSRDRYWQELRVAVPPAEAGLSRIDERSDLTQLGMVALSVLLARPIRDDEYPQQVDNLAALACARTTADAAQAFPSALRQWLRRVLQVDGRNSFRSAADAQAVFDQVLSSDSNIRADAGSLEAFMQRYHGTAAAPVAAVQPFLTPDISRPVSQSQTELHTPEPQYQPYEPLPLPEADSSEMSSEDAPELDHDEDEMTSPQTRRRPARLKWIVAGIAVLAVATVGLIAARQRLAPAVAPLVTGKMTVNTDPAGAVVEVDGTERGQSPISLDLPVGTHTLVVRANGESRTVPITIAAGAEVSQYLDLPKAGSALGQLQVRSEPAGARVSIDGTPVGRTPMTIVEIEPGEHAVTLESDMGSVTQKVTIEAGVQASLVVPMNAPAGAVASGWLAVTAPLVVDLQENGRLLGNSGIDKIMLPAGRHEIELISEHLGYRETRVVQVSPGRTANIAVTLPKGSVSLNAIPWASVSIDGESVGDTPIGNLQLTVGPHEVVFRNTELGEQRRVVTVTTRAPVRLSVDLTKK